MFPPQAGLTYSTWICVDKFGSFDKTHPIRILTLLRQTLSKDNKDSKESKETLTSCLAIYLNPKNRTLYVSTEESQLQKFGKENS